MERDSTYDIVKGLAIVMMVFAHTAVLSFHGLWKWINLFHLPVFFMLGGWFYRASNADSVWAAGAYIGKRLRRIWLPFVVWGGLFILLHDTFICCNIYSDNLNVGGYLAGTVMSMKWGAGAMWSHLKLVPFMLDGMGGMAGAFWFLRVLFFACIFYVASDLVAKLLSRACNRIWLHLTFMSVSAMIALVIARWYCPGIVLKFLSYCGGRQMLTAYGLIHVGVVLRYFRVDLSRISLRWNGVVCTVCALCLALQCRGEYFAIAANNYSSVTRLLCCSLLGWFMLISMSILLVSTGALSWLSHSIAYIGRHTLPILMFHFLAFKFVSLIGVLLKGMGWEWIAKFPVTFVGPGWSLAYTIIGVAFPLAVSAFFWMSVTGLRNVVYKRAQI